MHHRIKAQHQRGITIVELKVILSCVSDLNMHVGVTQHQMGALTNSCLQCFTQCEEKFILCSHLNQVVYFAGWGGEQNNRT